MTCRVYVGEYQDRITGAAATAYVVIDENGRLVKAMAQKVKTNKGLFASLLRGHDSTEPVSVDDTHEGLCTVRRVRAALSRTVRGRKPADTPPRRYNAGANTKRKQ